MKQHAMIAAALGSLLRTGRTVDTGASRRCRRQGKCYGVAKAGQNDCASPGSAHACAGQSKIDKDPMSWKYVPASTCAQMGGMMQAPSK
ncbi:BufA1 family periplasmic bufferin-type metallophore [Streptomyces sp. L7]